uniref:Uncharacterized protein n=1 Tax=Opuntia streptacantha TaxID=393608 RepID=A0A7C9DVH1_OPUST
MRGRKRMFIRGIFELTVACFYRICTTLLHFQPQVHSFLKRTLSFTDVSAAEASSNAVPKGFLAVDVGEDMKRFVIPTSYLSHQAFSVLLKEAEEEFGFQQEGVLRIPCEEEVFQNILKVVDAKNSPESKLTAHLSRNDGILCGSLESQSIPQSHHPSVHMHF